MEFVALPKKPLHFVLAFIGAMQLVSCTKHSETPKPAPPPAAPRAQFAPAINSPPRPLTQKQIQKRALHEKQNLERKALHAQYEKELDALNADHSRQTARNLDIKDPQSRVEQGKRLQEFFRNEKEKLKIKYRRLQDELSARLKAERKHLEDSDS